MTEPSASVRAIEDRRARAIRRTMAAKERIADGKLTRAEADELREVIYDEVADLARLAITLIHSLEDQVHDGASLNRLWLEQIAGAVGAELPESVGAG